jgi:hypothetical protein
MLAVSPLEHLSFQALVSPYQGASPLRYANQPLADVDRGVPVPGSELGGLLRAAEFTIRYCRREEDQSNEQLCG